MRHKKHMGKSVAALALTLVLLAGQMLPVAAVTWSDVNDLKDDASALSEQKKELESKLSSLANDKSKALERRELLDQKIGVLVTQINNAQQQISDYDTLIDQTQAELEEAEAKEAEQYDLFCRRVRAMEEDGGKLSYWSVLFKAPALPIF